MRKSSVLFGTIALACALGAIGAWRQLHIEREHVAQLERQVADLHKALNAAQVAASAPAIAPVTAPAPVPEAPRTASAAAAVAAEATRSPEVIDPVRAWQERERQMLRDPGYRKMQIEQGRRQFARTRTDAMRVVGMTPEQADRVIDLWVERNLRFMELGGANGQPMTEAAQAEFERAGEAEQAEVRSLLGDEKYERWSAYLASGQERGEVNALRAQLADSDALSAAQSDALVATIHAERRRREKEYEDYATSMGIENRHQASPEVRQRWLDLAKEANRRIHDSMASTLSAAQLASLDEMLASQLAPVESALRMQREGKVAKSN